MSIRFNVVREKELIAVFDCPFSAMKCAKENQARVKMEKDNE